MRFTRQLLIVAFALAVPASAGFAEMKPPEVEYRGDMTTQSGGQSMNGQMFYAIDRFRLNMKTPQGPAAMIVNLTEETGYMVMDQQRMAIRLPLERAQKNFSAPPSNARFEAMGQEHVNGVDTTKYQVSREDTSKDGFEGFAWMTEDRIVVRMDGMQYGPNGSANVKMDLTNLEIGDQPDRLFVVPDGYRVMNMGGR